MFMLNVAGQFFFEHMSFLPFFHMCTVLITVFVDQVGGNTPDDRICFSYNCCYHNIIIGFLRGGCSRGGGNWGTLRIAREDWGTLGNIRETPPLGPPPP